MSFVGLSCALPSCIGAAALLCDAYPIHDDVPGWWGCNHGTRPNAVAGKRHRLLQGPKQLAQPGCASAAATTALTGVERMTTRVMGLTLDTRAAGRARLREETEARVHRAMAAVFLRGVVC